MTFSLRALTDQAHMWDAARAEKLMKKQIAWIFTGAALVGLGMVGSLGACSSDDTKTDAGKDAAKDSTTGTDSGQDSGGQDAGNDVSTADCGSTPTLHPSDAGAIYCGFVDGGSLICGTGQQCCLGGKVGNTFQNQDCVTWGGTCDNPPPDSGTSPPVPIECGQNSDCTANGAASGSVCCLQGGTAPAQVAGCSYYKSSPGGSSIVCSAGSNGACPGSTDIQICSSDTDCPQGKTCTPMKWKIYQLGFCK